MARPSWPQVAPQNGLLLTPPCADDDEAGISTPLVTAEEDEVGIREPLATAEEGKVGINAPLATAEEDEVDIGAPPAAIHDDGVQATAPGAGSFMGPNCSMEERLDATQASSLAFLLGGLDGFFGGERDPLEPTAVATLCSLRWRLASSAAAAAAFWDPEGPAVAIAWNW